MFSFSESASNSLELMIYNESSEHFIYNIIEKDKGFFIGSGFYKGDNKKIKLGLNYNNKLIEEDLSVSDKSVEPKYLNQLDFRYIRFIIEYKYDTRDIYIDPHSGILFNIELDNMIGFDQTQNIYAIEIFFNIYKNLHDGIIRYNSIEPVFKYKLFSRTQLSNQDLPIFRKEYIAGQGYVRGYSAIPYNNIIDNPKKRIEVDNFLINTFEIQSTIIKRKEYINKMELGLDIILFADWGVGYNLNKFINFNNSLIGYGVGAKIFIMGGVLKLDYAFNPYGGGKLHLFD